MDDAREPRGAEPRARSVGGAATTRITAYPDGPLVVRGEFTVTGPGGELIETGRIAALCRCGRSALKPLCDGSHKVARRARPARPVED